MDYKTKLINLICGTDGQVDTYIKKVMREEDVNNGTRPAGKTHGTGRSGELQNVEPKHSSPQERGSSRLVADGDNPINNNPLYPSNMVDRLNTPFDYIERILLQDFSGKNAMDIEGQNYFKSVFSFGFNTSDYGVAGFTMSAQGTSSSYNKVNNQFKMEANTDNGGFFIDSFTYTPFIEYSVGDPRVGIYSDEFLTDYNTGKYNQGSGVNAHQKDTHRRTLSSELYQLRNLEQDIYSAKMNFRRAIQNQDQAVYIYTFCQHLAKLFAKLSNIRMSHEIYGFKHPHVQWEGILALDIWYQMLYSEIDGAYPFDEGLLNMNPMARKKIKTSGGNKYVEYDESGPNASKKLYQNNLGAGIQWIEDESAPGYAYIWDSNLWSKYNQKSADILATRDECVTPRGVLKKIWNIVNGWSFGPKKAEIADMSDGDFPWFKQKGNVYHHADGFAYSKYPNLHLGRAYEVMTSEEYYELTGQGLSGDKYQKPVFTKGTSPDSVLKTMVEHGCEALDDAFQVMKDKKVFRIVNSANNNVIEDFLEAHLANYSQGQCAIVIERVFSELYKYLQFKSTTSEMFQRHININSGYKYLTTESLLGSDNDASGVYYSDTDNVGYLRYLAKLNEYANGTVNIGLTDNEKKLLGQFISIVEKEPVEWLDKNWDLCPLCRGVGQLPRNAEQMERVRTRLASAVGFSLKSRDMSARAVDDEDDEEEGDDEDVKRTRIVYVYLNTGAGVTLNATDLSIPSGYTLESSGGKPDYFLSTQEVYDHEFNIDLSKVTASILNNPRFTYEGTTIQYTLLGFSDDRFATTAKYKKDEVLYSDTFDPDQSVIALHAVWSKKAIVKFLPGSIPTTGTMANMVVDANKNTKLANCTFVPDNPAWNMKKFIYHNSTSTPKLWNDVEGLNPSQQTVNKYELSYWEYRIDGNVVQIEDGGYINVTINPDDQPVVVLMANWREAWNSIGFEVEGQRYCDVLISAANPRLVHPVSPVMVDPNKTFIDWDRAEGSWLSGLEISGVPTVYEPSSGTFSNTRIICTDSPDIPIICLDDSMSEYGIKVNANIGVRETMNFGVMFKYLTDDGEYTDAYQNVAENTHIPSFHIHSTVIKNGKKMVFKYWELESGDLSSSMTILSPCVFVAVYEEVADQPSYPAQNKWNPDVLPDDEGTLTGAATFNGSSCPYISDLPDDGDESDEVCKQIDGINPTSRYYCKYLGRPPKQTDAQIADVDCPYIHLLLSGIDVSQYDFASLTPLEIQDVADLLKVLFKVNIDIAHREYYLKIDIPEVSDWWYGYKEGSKWYSFEPTVEYKFSNFHAANQPENGKLLCTVTPAQATDSPTMWITPINRELKDDGGAVHYNDFWYYYDFKKSFEKEWRVNSTVESKVQQITRNIGETQRYYAIKPLYLYENTKIQSPVDVNRFIRHRHGCIPREREYQLKTFMTIVKKYRPVIMPKVTDIFGQCNCATTKYQADSNNDYGVFGWCTIPSKTMVNMEYNEQAIIVPSTYDHHNRIGGSNFLQMDSDFVVDGTRRCVYEKLSGSKDTGSLVDNTKNTWYYLYNTRDWTYFMQPFFNMKRNNEIFGFMRDTYRKALWPDSSDHLNGIIFERSNEGRVADTEFLEIALTCQFLAKYHHNDNNLRILSERYTNLLDYNKLKELTISVNDEFNSKYGSMYNNIPDDFVFPEQDWIDDYDKTSSFVKLGVDKYKPGATSEGPLKYKYNLGQAHAIDDFDENSVWFYITMVEPIDDSEQVIELEDIMPFVFWWENRGRWNNGPTVDCYGHQGDAKMNYEKGGWCYSNAHQTYHENVVVNSAGYGYAPELAQEQCWHAVQHTLGTDFSKKEYGGTILTTDNSGNTYKGAFDPNCAATSEKWKIHHVGNAFGAPQHEDPVEDRYYLAYQAHGEGEFKGKLISDDNNAKIMESLQDRPMTWNLWNCVRHYVFMKYFKNRSRNIESKSDWNELEQYTKKLVKGIYRTFMDQMYTNKASKTRTRFGDALGGGSSSNSGNTCLVRWTNSFAEISSMLERNYREHQASFVLFTGNAPKDATGISTVQGTIRSKYGNVQNLAAMASGKYRYDYIANSHDNFVVETLNGVDSDIDGMRPRAIRTVGNPYGGFQAASEDDRALNPPARIYQGFKNVDIPSTYIIGDNLSYSQQLPQRIVDFHTLIDLDKEYPEAEYYLNDRSRKWVQRIRQAVMNRQIFPIYTSMETMTASVHDVTIDQLKSITFQVVPQFYWKYEWSYNEFMIHFVGRLESPSKDIVMYDMLGNVWEWVRDNWTANVRNLNPINPIVGGGAFVATKAYNVNDIVNYNGIEYICKANKPAATTTTPNVDTVHWEEHKEKVIRGGAFDQYCRKTISSSREGLDWDQFQSQFGTQANVGFRPSMVFTADFMDSGFIAGQTPVDLFFLFDASMSTGPVVQQMVDSANAIAKMFAPAVSGNSPSAAEREICHVGSALFLGPKIRLMCSNLMEGAVTEARQKNRDPAFGNGAYDISGDIYAVHFCQGPQRHSDGTYGWGWGAYSEPVGYNKQIEYGKADVLSLTGTYGPCGFIGDQRSFPDGIKTYFKNAFNKIRDDYQKSTESVMNSRSISGINDYRTMVDYDMEDFEEDEPLDIVEEKGFELEQEIKQESKVKAMDMMSRSQDGQGGNSGQAGEGNWGSYPYCIHNYEAVFEHMFVHRGVPIWNDISVGGGQLHFETDGVYALEHPVSAAVECCLNTYNPSGDPDAISRFENPFMQSRRGVLCNWWNGSEPVSHILAKLLGSGYFGGFPHTPPIGYVFRSPKIPKLVFVYTNEFDNSHTRTKTNNGENVLVMPGVTPGNDVRLYPAHGVATGLDGESLEGYFKTVKIKGNKHEIRMGITTPPDPYCLQIVKEYINNENASRTQMGNWMNSMNLESIFGTFTANAGSVCYPGSSWITFKPMRKTVLSNETKSEDYGYISDNLNFNAAVGMVSLPANVDLLRRGKNGVFAKEKKTWSYIDSIMAADQMSNLRRYGCFPGVEQGISISDYKWALTQGFYELHRVISEKTDPMNLYMFVTDANAPRPLTENSSAVDAMCLALDDYWVSEIKGKMVPGTSYTWKQAAYANLLYWQRQDGKFTDVDDQAKLTGSADQQKTNAKRINNVLGMDNPYTNTKIVWGIRDWDGGEPVWSSRTKVYGFPMGYGKSSRRKMANLLDKTESDCESLCLGTAEQWRSNNGNRRMTLTADNADLVFVDWAEVEKDGKVKPSEKHIYYAPIDRLVSPESIRYDQVSFNCYAWGCYRNSYAFSPEFTIDDAVTIPFNDHGGGCIKILCWNSLAVVSPPMKDLNGKGKPWEEPPPDGHGYEINWEGGTYKYGSKFGLPSIVYRGNSLGPGYTSQGPYIRRGYGNNFYATTRFVPAGNSKIPVGSSAWKIFYNLRDPNSKVYKKAGEDASLGAYPNSFKNVIAKLAKSVLNVKMVKRDGDFNVPGQTLTSTQWKELWQNNGGLRDAVMNQYTYLKNVLPYAMAYRFHRDIFSRLVNGLGNPVTDYDDDENVVIFKALPVTNFTKLKDVFSTSFQEGMFNSSSSFQYSHCIVDLNPNPDLYGEAGYRPASGSFPLVFANDIEVNTDEYKKSKIVFQRIEPISGTKHDSLQMGERVGYYGRVTDPDRIKYSDDESIKTASTDNFKNITLGNGGSYQKKHPEIDPQTRKTSTLNDDLYNVADPDKPRKKKYSPNRHFFMDPFQLTVAQWCHAHEKHTKHAAIQFIAGGASSSTFTTAGKAQLNEMAKSYWKYLMVWEHDTFVSYKSGNPTYENGSDQDYLEALYEDADAMCNSYSQSGNYAYDPLNDMRPYYYATYQNVRGTSQVYNIPERPASIPQAQWKWSTYAIDSAKGDEFQMNTRTGGTSFMDILNSKVVMQGRKREYMVDVEGAERLNRTAMDAQTSAEKEKRTWRSGKEVGLNFDLPTEAQWEYCCRAGSTSAFPTKYNLGINFEEADNNLDVIAWYKYKVIGALPEPERFCAWRISKLLFGITKDKEMINNVYETTD